MQWRRLASPLVPRRLASPARREPSHAHDHAPTRTTDIHTTSASALPPLSVLQQAAHSTSPPRLASQHGPRPGLLRKRGSAGFELSRSCTRLVSGKRSPDPRPSPPTRKQSPPNDNSDTNVAASTQRRTTQVRLLQTTPVCEQTCSLAHAPAEVTFVGRCRRQLHGQSVWRRGRSPGSGTDR